MNKRSDNTGVWDDFHLVQRLGYSAMPNAFQCNTEGPIVVNVPVYDFCKKKI